MNEVTMVLLSAMMARAGWANLFAVRDGLPSMVRDGLPRMVVCQWFAERRMTAGILQNLLSRGGGGM